MTEPKDKRTTAWKVWKGEQELKTIEVVDPQYQQFKENFDEAHKDDSKGLGDSIAKVAKAVGADKLVKWVAGEDCGCKERREAANKKYGYHQIQCPNQKQAEWIVDFFKPGQRHLVTGKVDTKQQENIVKIINHSFGTNHKAGRCGSCVGGWINQMKKLHESYV